MKLSRWSSPQKKTRARCSRDHELGAALRASWVKTLNILGIVGQVRRQNLQGDNALQLRVSRARRTAAIPPTPIGSSSSKWRRGRLAANAVVRHGGLLGQVLRDGRRGVSSVGTGVESRMSSLKPRIGISVSVNGAMRTRSACAESDRFLFEESDRASDMNELHGQDPAPRTPLLRLLTVAARQEGPPIEVGKGSADPRSSFSQRPVDRHVPPESRENGERRG